MGSGGGTRAAVAGGAAARDDRGVLRELVELVEAVIEKPYLAFGKLHQIDELVVEIAAALVRPTVHRQIYFEDRFAADCLLALTCEGSEQRRARLVAILAVLLPFLRENYRQSVEGWLSDLREG